MEEGLEGEEGEEEEEKVREWETGVRREEKREEKKRHKHPNEREDGNALRQIT